MRQLGLVGTIFIGFVAGVFFVISCGGGGSKVMAEITDITGIVTGLSDINSSIQAIDNSTDMSGVTTALGSVTTAIGGVTLSTDMSGVVSELQNIDMSLQEIILVMGSSTQTPLSMDYITDATVPTATGDWTFQSTGGGSIDITGYRQARLYALPESGSLHIGVKYSIGSISGTTQDLGTFGQIYVADLLGDTMEVEVANFDRPPSIVYSIAVQLIP